MWTKEVNDQNIVYLRNPAGELAVMQPFDPKTGESFTFEQANAWADEELARFNIPMTTPPANDYLKQQTEDRIRKAGAMRLASLASPYSQEEQSTWSIQLKEAEAWTLDNQAATPMLDALTSSRQITKQELVTKILQNAQLFRFESGRILGIQQLLLDKLSTIDASNSQELDKLQWPVG